MTVDKSERFTFVLYLFMIYLRISQRLAPFDLICNFLGFSLAIP